MRQLWMIRLAFRYLLMGGKHAAWPPQPAGLVCMPFSGMRGSIGEADFGVPLAVSAHFAERSPSLPGFPFRGPFRGTNPNTVRAGRHTLGGDCVMDCTVPIRFSWQLESGFFAGQSTTKPQVSPSLASHYCNAASRSYQ
jgi:hypothetical protein